MKLLALITAVLLLPQEKNEAEELFKKMEEKIAKARTAQARVTGELGPTGIAITATCWLGEGKEARVDLEGRIGGGVLKSNLISDGKKVRLEAPGKDPALFDAPEHLGRLSRTFLTRNGIMGMFDMAFESKSIRAESAPNTRMTDIASGAREKVGDREALEVRYRLGGGKDPDRVSVWIDVATHLPLKRVVKQGDTNLTVTYSEFKLNEKIDAAKFELPKEAK